MIQFTHARPVRGLAAALLLGSALVTPAMAETTITAVMHSGLRVLDPVITTAHITRNHAYMIYDVLVAVDDTFTPQPQMASWEASADGLTYTFTLRDGLKFHDGAPVTAADAEASLKRWAKRDGGGQLIMDVTDSLTATDDKTLVWKLKQPFGPLIDILAKQSALPPFIMPARVAATPADTPITEHVGSGPFRFVEAEFQPGVLVTYVKNTDYVPRAEPANWYSGGKVVNVDKVVWTNISDPQTQINAVLAGEIDFLEFAQTDLLPLLEGEDDVVVEVRDPLGYQTMGRINFLHPPFDNQKARQAVFKALDQEAVMAALVGNPDYYTLCAAALGCGAPLESTTGAESLTSGGDIAAAKALLAESGYDGTPITIMHATDVVTLGAQAVVASAALRQVGFNVDMQSMDWQTLVTRRASQAKPSEGGWNIFFTNWMVPEISSPLGSPMLNGRGDGAWFGWPTDPVIEQLKNEYVAATDLAGQKAVGEKVQAHNSDHVLFIPLGQYQQAQVRRTNITDMIPSPVPLFWGIKKN